MATLRGSAAAAPHETAVTRVFAFPNSAGPFVYYPQHASGVTAEALTELLFSDAGKVIRSEITDYAPLGSPMRSPAIDKIKEEFVSAAEVRHVVRVEASGQDFQVSVASGRLIHFAISRGEREIVRPCACA